MRYVLFFLLLIITLVGCVESKYEMIDVHAFKYSENDEYVYVYWYENDKGLYQYLESNTEIEITSDIIKTGYWFNSNRIPYFYRKDYQKLVNQTVILDPDPVKNADLPPAKAECYD